MNKIFKLRLQFNRIVRVFVMVDFFFNSALGLFAPVFAIFILENIQGGSARVVGFAAAIYWIVKSIFQLPIARFLDKTDGESDDFWVLSIGYFLTSFVPLLYILVKEPWHLYVIQGFFGFCMAWAVPAWYGIFTRHLDNGRISFEWSLESVISVGLATSIATATGGYIADVFGFTTLFTIASALSFVATFSLLLIRKDIKPIDHKQKVVLERVNHRSL
ncbi:MAG: MFS transporter [bacterium]|nr:MFS transporter [bacterium]